MESSFIDTPQTVNRHFIARHVEYWSKIDDIDCELSGMSAKYNKLVDLHDAMGVGDRYTRNIAHKLRKRLLRAQ